MHGFNATLISRRLGEQSGMVLWDPRRFGHGLSFWRRQKTTLDVTVKNAEVYFIDRLDTAIG
jgi:hypothetical protein